MNLSQKTEGFIAGIYTLLTILCAINQDYLMVILFGAISMMWLLEGEEVIK
jgi:hypothetical protein